MRRVLLGVALAALVLSGCDTLRRMFGMASGPPVVSVSSTGQISVAPDPLDFPGGANRQAVVIVWTLDGPASDAGFKFADASKGIKIERQVSGPPKDIRREFTDHKVLAGGKKFQVKNMNTGEGKYKYSITLVDSAGRELPPHDPFIVNGH